MLYFVDQNSGNLILFSGEKPDVIQRPIVPKHPVQKPDLVPTSLFGSRGLSSALPVNRGGSLPKEMKPSTAGILGHRNTIATNPTVRPPLVCKNM